VKEAIVIYSLHGCPSFSTFRKKYAGSLPNSVLSGFLFRKTHPVSAERKFRGFYILSISTETSELTKRGLR